jgi:hypothetical protein
MVEDSLPYAGGDPSLKKYNAIAGESVGAIFAGDGGAHGTGWTLFV